ncbi:medium-chain fatty acid-CoA ligase faa2 [Balamuthia mandrillaris]
MVRATFYTLLLWLGTLLLALAAWFGVWSTRPRKRSALFRSRQERERLHERLSVEVRTKGEQPPEGETPVRRSPEVQLHQELPASFNDGEQELYTLFDCFESMRRRFGRRLPCLGTRANSKRGYRWKNYEEVAQLKEALGRGMRMVGIKEKDRVGISRGVAADGACLLCQLVRKDTAEYIINHSEIRALVCSNENLERVLKIVDKCPELEMIIHMDKLSDEFKSSTEDRLVRQGEDQLFLKRNKGEDVAFIYFWDLLEDGDSSNHDNNKKKRWQQEQGRVPAAKRPTPGDLCTIMYTSGTTGSPKGVTLTHQNIVAMMGAAERRVEGIIHAGDTYLSYLPLAHIFERVVTSTLLYLGVGIGFFQGSVAKLMDDLAELKPSIFCGVPRVYERIHDKVKEAAEGNQFKKFLFEKAMKAGKKALLEEGKEPPLLWRILLFNRLQGIMGGNVRAMLSGGAPLSPSVHEFLMVAMGCPLVQAYGATESAAGATMGYLNAPTTGDVGGPFACTEIKLKDVPEMGYTHRDKPCPRGEIVIRGPNVSSGYYKLDREDDSFKDGWFYTGDIGQWNENGSLSVIDRKKNFFKLSQGEYIAAEKLEGVYDRCELVDKTWVYGDSHRSAVIAVIQPHKKALAELAQELHGGGSSKLEEEQLKELCQDKEIRQRFLKRLQETGKEQGLQGFEIVRNVHLSEEEWTEDNDLLTPTMKLKRHSLKKHFQSAIDERYEELEQKGRKKK